MDKVSKPVAAILNGKKKKKGIHDVLNITYFEGQGFRKLFNEL